MNTEFLLVSIQKIKENGYEERIKNDGARKNLALVHCRIKERTSRFLGKPDGEIENREEKVHTVKWICPWTNYEIQGIF